MGNPIAKLMSILLLAGAVHAQVLTPIQKHGELRVSGNRIVNQSGANAQLVGPSFYWSIWGGERYYNRQVVDWLVSDWHASLVRAAIAVEPTDGYLTNSSTQVARAKAIIDAAIANGVYVIVDWHAHDANLHVNEAKAFFAEIGRTYGNIPNIIWEIWNEPNSTGGTGSGGKDTWADIKNYAAQVIPTIRQYSDNIIVVGTPSWCQTVGDAANDPISGANIAYTLHFYAVSHKDWLRTAADQALNKGIALFITEFGLSHADGGSASNRGIDTVEGKKWLDWADARSISWANWSIVNFTESSAALAASASVSGGWTDNDLSESGKWIRRRIRATNPSIPVSSSSRPSSSSSRPSSSSVAVSSSSVACTPSTILPYVKIGNGAWQQSTQISVPQGDSLIFGPQPHVGTWRWTGPMNFVSNEREVRFTNIRSNQAGSYMAFYTNASGCSSTQSFSVTVTEPQVFVMQTKANSIIHGLSIQVGQAQWVDIQVINALGKVQWNQKVFLEAGIHELQKFIPKWAEQGYYVVPRLQ